jgi:hypothetical protein
MHVPLTLHREEVRRLARGPTETDADLDRRQFAIYAEEAAAIPDDAPIADPNEIVFWKRVLQARRRRELERAPPVAARSVWACPDHTPPCTRWTEHRERLLADNRAKLARNRQTG